MKKLEILFCLCLFFLVCTSELITVNTETNRLVDSDGRERIFHGVNVVYKGPPYHPVVDHFDPFESFSLEDIKLLHGWGFNSVRLGMMWPGAQPTSSTSFNQTYFDVLKGIVKQMSSYNMFALLDAHQDVYNEHFCGEGAPDWATILLTDAESKFPLPVIPPFTLDNRTGYPFFNECNAYGFQDFYFSFQASYAFQQFYNNKNGILDAFANFWKTVAEQFKEEPNILGYEIINEPWAGDIYENPALFVPGVADIVNLAPLYEKVNTALRLADPDHLFFYEPVTWDNFGVGFKQVPGGDDYLNRSVLAYHYYVPPDIDIEQSMIARMNDIRRLGGGGFMTEFSSGDDSSLSDTTLTTDALDRYLQSWTTWEYKKYVPITGWGWGFFYPNGSVDVPVVRSLSRSYAYAIAGITRSMYFDSDSSDFVLEYEINPSCNLPTEIYLNEDLYYSNGFSVLILPNGVATWRRIEERNYIAIDHFLKQKVVITVVVTAK